MRFLFKRVHPRARARVLHVRTRAGVLLALVMAGATFHMSPAAAHSIYTRKALGGDGNMCVIGVSEISDNDEARGRAVGKVETRTADPGWLSCFVRPPSYQTHGIAIILDYLDNNWQWQVCTIWDFDFRNNATSSVRNMNSVASLCGSTWYLTIAGDVARSGPDKAWIGDWVISGDYPNGNYAHYFTA